MAGPSTPPAIGPRRSVIEQGNAGELRQRAFWQLWELNRRISSGAWGPVGDVELREKLEGAIPLGDDLAPVWGPGPIRSHPEGFSAAGLQPSSVSRPLMS